MRRIRWRWAACKSRLLCWQLWFRISGVERPARLPGGLFWALHHFPFRWFQQLCRLDFGMTRCLMQEEAADQYLAVSLVSPAEFWYFWSWVGLHDIRPSGRRWVPPDSKWHKCLGTGVSRGHWKSLKLDWKEKTNNPIEIRLGVACQNLRDGVPARSFSPPSQ